MPILLLLLLLVSGQFPRTASESLAGQPVTLPDSLAGHAAVVIAGFTRSSQEAVKAWDKAARKQLGGACEVYVIAVLEDAPSFVRGLIKRSIKSSLPADRQGHFLVVVKGEAELKIAAGFREPDDPYVILVDSAGKINWRVHGAVSDTAVQELAKRISDLK